MKRVLWLRQFAPDVLVIAGVCLVAGGAAWYSLGLAPIILGLGLIAAVRYGGR
jgi:hypothetical protein